MLLSGTQHGSGMSSAESYFILQKNERDGRDQDLCRDNAEQLRCSYKKVRVLWDLQTSLTLKTPAASSGCLLFPEMERGKQGMEQELATQSLLKSWGECQLH